MRTVNVSSRVVGTFVKTDSLDHITGITQDEKSGDLYVTAYNAVYRIAYTQRTVKLISGSPSTDGYRDSTLLNSLFDYPVHVIVITPGTLLVADYNNKKLRRVDMKSDKVTTLSVTNLLNEPYSLLLTSNTLYVGQRRKITHC